MPTNFENTLKQLEVARKELMTKPNVVATGIGFKKTAGKNTPELAIVCSVDSKKPLAQLKSSAVIPARIQDVPTDVVATGMMRAFTAPTERFRPAPGGCSVSHPNVTAGTLGCWVKHQGELYLLSNNHVLANSNEAARGDLILQPGVHDGGLLPDDVLAELADFIPLHFREEDYASDCRMSRWLTACLNGLYRLTGSRTRIKAYRVEKGANLVDCAIAKPIDVNNIDLNILQIGAIQGLGKGELGMHVKKMGRTTGLTTGVIEQTDVMVNVSYGYNKTALFTNQLLAGPMSEGGDSGSAVLDFDSKLVGLLFGGSESATLINRIDDVFGALKLTLPDPQTTNT